MLQPCIPVRGLRVEESYAYKKTIRVSICVIKNKI